MSDIQDLKKTFNDLYKEGIASAPPEEVEAIMATLQVRATIAVAEEISLLRQAIIDKPNKPNGLFSPL